MKKTFRHMFALGCLLTAAVALAGCTTPEGEKVGLGHIVGSLFQHAEVAPEEVSVLDFVNPLDTADRDIDELTMAMQRPVIVNIHNLEGGDYRQRNRGHLLTYDGWHFCHIGGNAG